MMQQFRRWVAMDRGSDLARAMTTSGPSAGVRRRTSCGLRPGQGVDGRDRFRQRYTNDELDASLDLIPILESTEEAAFCTLYRHLGLV